MIRLLSPTVRRRLDKVSLLKRQDVCRQILNLFWL